MPRLEYFLVAQGVSIDQSTNSVSVFNVYEEFQPVEYPSPLPTVAALACWEIAPDEIGSEHVTLLRISGPIPNGTAEFQANVIFGSPRHRVVNRITNLPVLGPGAVNFELLLDGQHAASHSLTVTTHPAFEAQVAPH